ncbi:hypothetical protein PsorP6_014453 [Peronosclerospora sorghi]|uniref:Uncharacterized protein n=1 Tax=Peronosclerospora sorghi TaxID=230839 RepID=A0ACC0VRM2_9STRA|nr:hypothetical protein PsorP6_014453 [Peronosclerospora sorghi]
MPSTDSSLVTVMIDRGSNMHSADGIPIIHKRTLLVEGKNTALFYDYYDVATPLFGMIDDVKALVT